jgi:hypothetical protein
MTPQKENRLIITVKSIAIFMVHVLTRTKKQVIWRINYYFSKRIPSNAVKFTAINKRILVLSPHADDELIGCDQLLKSNNSCEIYYCGFLGSDTSNSNANVRLNELLAYSLHNNVECNVVPNGQSNNYYLTSVIKRYKPDIIAVPFIYDWHYQHYLTNTLLAEAIIDMQYECDILQYQISVPIPNTLVTHYSCMSKSDHKLKWQGFMEIYKSQIMIPYARFKIVEKIAGKSLNCFASEVYWHANTEVWVSFLKTLTRKEHSTIAKALNFDIDNISLTLKNINDIINRRK